MGKIHDLAYYIKKIIHMRSLVYKKSDWTTLYCNLNKCKTSTHNDSVQTLQLNIDSEIGSLMGQ